MQITGSHSLSSLRQPSTMMGGHQGQRLVFLYPMIFDSSLSEFTDDIRDFFSVDFMSEIKISNILNVTSKATNIGVVRSGGKSLNPAQEVRKSLHYSYDYNNDNMTQNPDNLSVHAYQEKINSFLNFIRNQLRHDPKYSKLRPMISSITLQENLINIPLILGTKSYTADPNSLYWVLLIAMAWNIPLNNENSLDMIERYMNSMPNTRYIDLLFSSSGRADIMRRANINVFDMKRIHDNDMVKHAVANKFERQIKYESFKSLSLMRNCLSLTRWEVESGHLGAGLDTRNSMTTSPTITTETQRYHFERSMASFQSYMSNSIMPILHSMEYLLGPTPTHINFQSKINDFEYNSNESLTKTFIDLSNHVTGQIRKIVNEETDDDGNIITTVLSNKDRFGYATNNIKNVLSMCEANIELTSEIKKILINELEPILHIPIRFNADDIGRFSKGIHEVSSKLKRHSMILEDFLKSALQDPAPFNQHINTIKQRFQDSIRNFFYGPDHNNALYDTRIENDANINYYLERYQNFTHVICNNPIDPRSQLICRDRFTQFIYQLEISIREIMYFFYIWNFISYLCGYMKDVDIDVKVQKRDVLEFPNYCLIVPLDIIKLLYSLSTVSNFQRLVTSNRDNIEAVSKGMESDDIAININNINNMIRTINRRLQVPNIVVVNSKKQEIYYKFMYMNDPSKLSISSMKAYVNHQLDILPGF